MDTYCLRQKFAGRLRAALREHNTNAHAFASACGLDDKRLYSYTSGRCWPSAYAVAQIAKALGISADWLLGIDKEDA